MIFDDPLLVSIPYRHLINWKRGKIGGGEEKVSIPYRHLINTEPTGMRSSSRMPVSIPYRHLINYRGMINFDDAISGFQSLIGT